MAPFFKTKAGKMTVAFIIIMIGFVLILVGLPNMNNALIYFGFFLLLGAMLYSPIDVFLLQRKKSPVLKKQ